MTVASLDPSTGGPSRSVPRLGEAVKKVGADVQLFVNNQEGKIGQNKNATSESLSVNAVNKLGDAVKKLKEKNLNNVLIHNHGIWLPINHYASETAKRFNIPLIISPRGMLEPWALNYRRLKKTIAWILYQRRDLKIASVFHAASDKEANSIESLGLRIPMAIIPNGVDIPMFRKLGEDIKKERTALFLGRIHSSKGLINLVRAWTKICPEYWNVLIAGPDEGGHKAEVELEIQRHGLSDTFNFVGPVEDSDKWEMYKNADLFVLPTFSENFGIVVAEALASGLPVITTKGSPWAELEEHKCGWWIDIGVEPLAKALQEAIKLTPEERKAMGLRGRQLVEQNYSWDKIGKEMLSVYEWVLKGGSPPSCVILD